MAILVLPVLWIGSNLIKKKNNILPRACSRIWLCMWQKANNRQTVHNTCSNDIRMNVPLEQKRRSQGSFILTFDSNDFTKRRVNCSWKCIKQRLIENDAYKRYLKIALNIVFLHFFLLPIIYSQFRSMPVSLRSFMITRVLRIARDNFQNLNDFANSAAVACVLSPLNLRNSAMTCALVKPRASNSLTVASVNGSWG